MDPTEGKVNHLNPGAMVLIQGLRVAVKGEDPANGVTFTKAGSPSTTVFIPASKIYPNTPTKLQFLLPADVTEGQWDVSVTTQSSSSSVLLKQPRTGVYEDIVTVGDASYGDDDGPVIE